MGLDYKTCLDCKKVFYINDEDKAFFEKMSMPAPKRCWSCRKARKKAREEAGIVVESVEKIDKD